MKRLILASILLIIQPSFSQKLIDLKGLKEKLETERSPQKNILIKIQIGTIYESNGFYSNALMYYNQILNCYKSKEKDSLYVIVNNKIGSIYNTTKQYKNALSFLTEANIISEKLNYKIGLANALNLMGANYEKQGDYLKALQFENKSLGYLSPKLHKFETANVYENIGSIYEDLLQFDKASSYYQKAYSFFKGTGTKEEANILNNLADIHRKKNELNTAIQITGQSLNLAKKINDNHLQESAYKDFAKVYALKEDYKKAYVFRIEAEKFKEKALINENKNQINLLLTDFEIDRKESQIKILEEQAKSGKTQFLFIIYPCSVNNYYHAFGLLVNPEKRIANLKIRNYEQQQLQAELNQKWIEEKNMQKNLELKTATLSNYSLHIAQKNKILADLSFKLKSIASRKTINHESLIKDLYSEIDFTLQQENEWQDFNIFFEEIHPNYIKNLSSAAIEDLSPTELKLGILLRLNMSSKEIASILRVTPDSVRVARHRFRKKLPIDSKKELVNFLLEL